MDVLSAKVATPYAASTLPSYPAPAEAASFAAYCAFFETLLQRSESALVLLTGATGMGKCVLLDEFSALGRRAGWQVHEVVTSQLGAYSVAEPAVLTVENINKVHEAPLLEALASLNEGAEGRRPTLVVVTVGSSDLAQMPELKNFFQASGYILTLGAMTRPQVAEEFRSALAHAGCSPEELTHLVQETAGHPLMVHLIREELTSCTELTDHESTRIVEAARTKIGQLVWEPLLAKLSGGDHAFLEAMALDDEPSKMQHISSRLGKSPQYTGVYRNRLVAAEIIRAASYGKVTFTLPLLRHHLRQVIAQRMENQF